MLFKNVAANSQNPKWDYLIKREFPLYKRKGDPRTDFIRDYNRILHCLAYRRLKHKTQVFFAPENDHICTRIEHVNHVTSISNTISNALGLNEDLTNAIAIGHDIGHTPFGHEGEKILGQIAKRKLNQVFWHERNSLWFADSIETIPDENNKYQNLNLTYAVRDGLICHCGEIDDEAVIPRQEAINLQKIKKPAEFQPFTWEGCVVKIADKIAYLGRDVEDAFTLEIMSTNKFYLNLIRIFPEFNRKILSDSGEINNTILIHSFVSNLLKSSSPENGLCFSKWYLELMKSLRKVSERLIYESPRLKYSKERVKLILNSIFDVLSSSYTKGLTIQDFKTSIAPYPLLKDNFSQWLIKFASLDEIRKREMGFINRPLYNIQIKGQFNKAIIDFIAAMTDNFAIRVFNELTRFG